MEQHSDTLNRIYGRYRGVFWTAVVTGLFSYGFALTNILHNHDSIFYSPRDYGAGLSSGRWFLSLLGDFMEEWWGNYSLPLFNGLIAVLLLAAAACLIISLLEIKSCALALPAAAVFTAFPSAGIAMLYIYTVHYYAFAVLLAVTGAWLTKRYRLGYLVGGVCICLSMGIYQAYFPLAASLLLLCLLGRCFSEDGEDFRQLFLTALRYLAALVLGIVLYFLLLRLLLRLFGVTLTSYSDINEMGQLSLAQLPQILLRAYREVLLFPLEPVYEVGLSKIIRFAFLLCQGASLVLFVLLLAFSRRSPLRKALAALCFLLLPLAFNLIVVMCYSTYIQGLMAYSLVCVYFLPLLLLELISETGKLRPSLCRRWAPALLSLTLALAAFNYAWQNNLNYMTLYYADQQTVQYFSSMLTRIRCTEGYSQDKKLAVVGDLIKDRSFYNFVSETSGAQYHGNFTTYIDRYSWESWFGPYFAFNQPRASREELEAAVTQEELEAMPCYPDDGSIRVVGDLILLNIGYERPPETDTVG